MTKWVVGGNGGVKGLKNVLGGKVGVGVDVGGIVLHEGFGGAEGRKMRSERTPSTMTRPEVVFQVGGKREGTIKGKAVGTGAI